MQSLNDEPGASGVAPRPEPFLGGWGGMVVAALGFFVVFVVATVVGSLWRWLTAFLIGSGVEVDTVIALFFWVQITAWLIWGSMMLSGRASLDGLRDLRLGTGDWSVVRRLVIDVALWGSCLWAMWFQPPGLEQQYDAYKETTGWLGVAVIVVGSLTAWRLQKMRANRRGKADATTS